MEYANLFELLRAVRAYQLKRGEGLAPSNSVRGTHVGFCTVDSVGPSTRWTISLDALRASCEGSEEAQEIYRRMLFHQDRRLLLKELRSGKLSLDIAPSETPIPQKVKPPEEPTREPDSEEDQETLDFLSLFKT